MFRKNGESITHFWGTEMAHEPADPGQNHRGIDLVSPIFQLFDTTPEGRGDFLTSLHYDR